MRRHHHPRHREPSLDLVRQTAPRGTGGMTAAFAAAVQVDDHRPAPVSGSLVGNPQDIVQARPRGVHDPLTFQLDFATGNAGAARQEIIINRRLVSGQFPGALPPSPALRATPVRLGTPVAPGHRTRVRPVAPETVVRFTRHGLKSLAFAPKGQALAAASRRPPGEQLDSPVGGAVRLNPDPVVLVLRSDTAWTPPSHRVAGVVILQGFVRGTGGVSPSEGDARPGSRSDLG